MCTKPQLKLVIATWHCLHHVTELMLYVNKYGYVICKQMWQLCVFKRNLNSLWSYGIGYTSWHLFILCGCKRPSNLKWTELNTWFGCIAYLSRTECCYGHRALVTSHDFCLHHRTDSNAVSKQIWLLCGFNLYLNPT